MNWRDPRNEMVEVSLPRGVELGMRMRMQSAKGAALLACCFGRVEDG